MTDAPRRRVLKSLRYEKPDRVPVRIFAAPGGLYEHGEKLLEAIKACGHDFGDLSGLALPTPPGPEAFDPDGRYHEFKTDDWGTRWEFRIYGIWGHPVQWPLDDLNALDTYQPPAVGVPEGPGFQAHREQIAQHKERYYSIGGGGSLFEKFCSIRRFEDVLVDIARDTPEANRVGDMLVGYCRKLVDYALALGVDGICFGDDFGTNDACIFAPETWRRFFKPRYEELFAPIRAAGKDILFHCCGHIAPILPDLRELGVRVIWPQITAYKAPELAAICRDLGLVVELHPDRGWTLQRGTPEDIRRHVHELLEIFRAEDGGSWLYVEVDPGFPWENAKALVDVARELRGTC